MITIEDHQQAQLSDPWDFLSPKCKKMHEQGWSGLFRNEILSELPINKLTPFFCSNNGRPSNVLHTLPTGFLLQQMMDLSDEKTVDQLAFNIPYYSALTITKESDSTNTQSSIISFFKELLIGILPRLLNIRMLQSAPEEFRANWAAYFLQGHQLDKYERLDHGGIYCGQKRNRLHFI